MATEWMDFLAKYRKNNPNLKGAEVMKQAGIEYRKKKGTKGAVEVSKVKKGKKDLQDFSSKKGDVMVEGGTRIKGRKAFENVPKEKGKKKK